MNARLPESQLPKMGSLPLQVLVSFRANEWKFLFTHKVRQLTKLKDVYRELGYPLSNPSKNVKLSISGIWRSRISVPPSVSPKDDEYLAVRERLTSAALATNTNISTYVVEFNPLNALTGDIAVYELVKEIDRHLDPNFRSNLLVQLRFDFRGAENHKELRTAIEKTLNKRATLA